MLRTSALGWHKHFALSILYLSLSFITHTQKQANKGELAVEMFLFVLVISLINMEKRNSQIGFSVSFSSSVWRAPVNCNSQRRKIHTDRI
jgi:hypothetical protein